MEEERWDWMHFCKKHTDIVESRILALQNIMRNINLLDELHYFGNSGVRYSDDFVETGFAKWINAVETGEPYFIGDWAIPSAHYVFASSMENVGIKDRCEASKRSGVSRWDDAQAVDCFVGEYDYIATLLPQIPFEKAYRHKNPEFSYVSDTDILREVFGDDIEWRHNPSTVLQKMEKEERQNIYNHFEYMFYYVINVKQELAYDIETSL